MKENLKKRPDRNVMLQTTLRYMKLNRKRTLMTFLGIMLMVTLMTCAFVGKDTALGYMEKLGSLKDGSWHVAVYHNDIETLKNISELEFVSDSEYSTDYGFIDFEPTSGTDRPYLFVKAYGEKDFDWMNIRLTEGRFPQSGSELVISRAVLDDGAQINIGDVIPAKHFDRYLECTGYNGASATILAYYGIALEYGAEPVKVGANMCLWGEDAPEIGESHVYTGKNVDYTVVGFIESPGFETASSANYIALTLLENAGELDKCNMVLKYDRKAVKKHPNASIELYDMVASPSDLDFNNYVLAYSGLSTNSSVNTIAVGAVVFFVVLIMLASVLLIYNIFQISLDERSRWLGQLTAIGATRRQKRSSIFYECFMLLAAAVPAGLALGMGLIAIGMRLLKPALGAFAHLDSYTDQCPVRLIVSWKAVALIILMSCLTVLLSALIPARRVGKIGPLASIRGADSAGGSAHYILNEKRASSLSPEAWLAFTNTRRCFGRNMSIIRAAAIFMAILVITTYASDLITRVTDSAIGYTQQSEHLKNSDYLLTAYSEDKTEYMSFKSGLAQEDSVVSMFDYMTCPWMGVISYDVMSEEYKDVMTDIFYDASGHYPDEAETEEYFSTRMVNLIVVDNDTYGKLCTAADGVFPSVSDTDVLPALVVNDGKASTDTIAFGSAKAQKYKFYEMRRMTGLGLGDRFETVAVPLNGSTEICSWRFEIAGLISGNQLEKYCPRINPDELLVVISSDTADKLTQLGYDIVSRATAECVVRLDGTDKQLEERLEEMADESSMTIDVMSLKYAATLSEAISRIVRILLACFVLVVSIICLINLGNSIKSRLLERKQEFAAMRTIGITDGQLRKQLLLECIGHILFSTLIAAVVSALLIAALFFAVNSIIGRLLLTLPWYAIACAALASAAAVLIFTLIFFPFRKSESLIEEIRRNSI